MIFLAAIVCMAIQDGLGTFLVVAETRGRALLAGGLDAFGDIARLELGGLIAIEVGKSIVAEQLLILVIACTSLAATATATKLATRLKAAGE